MDEPDLSAFWLYPDWDGPVKEPFWMRPLKLPETTNTILTTPASITEFGTSCMQPGTFMKPRTSYALAQSSRDSRS